MMGGDNDPFSASQGSPPHCESPSAAFPSSASLCVRFCPPHLLWSLVVCVWLPGFCTLIHLLLIVLIWLSLVCSQIQIEPPPAPAKARRFAWLQKSFHVCRQPTGIQGRSLKGKRTFSELWSRAELNRGRKTKQRLASD